MMILSKRPLPTRYQEYSAVATLYSEQTQWKIQHQLERISKARTAKGPLDKG